MVGRRPRLTAQRRGRPLIVAREVEAMVSDQSGSAAITLAEAERLVASVKVWHHIFEVFPGVWTPGVYHAEFLWNKLGVEDWKGVRVLDVGPADGAMSMWAARAGAQVTSIDYKPKTMSGFAVMEQLSGLQFDFRVGNVLDLPRMELGLFDTVLFMGVLYHLADPLRGLYACRCICRGRLFLETWYDPDLAPDVPAIRYVPCGTHPDHTNFWVPNRAALMTMLTDAGFEPVREDAWGNRIFVEARAVTDGVRLLRMAGAYANRGADWPSLLPYHMDYRELEQRLAASAPEADQRQVDSPSLISSAGT